MKNNVCFVPKANSPAGLCLTMANWQEIGIRALSFSLENLLIKPGLEVLQSVPLKTYLSWNGTIILNAQHLSMNNEGVCKVVSPFDGNKILISATQLTHLVQHMQPDIVLLPPGLLTHDLAPDWSHGIKIFLHPQDAPVAGYQVGDVGDMVKHGTQFFESDQPATQGMHGKVYSALQWIDLKGEQYKADFTTIDPQCACPTCSLQLTKAYLHHLYLHTPLLCQRFLIQHNVYTQVLSK